MDAITLAALLCSRVCHDLVNPIGAVNNGVELMEESADAATRDGALSLVAKSARTAIARVKVYRLAFGGAPTAAMTPMEEAREAFEDMIVGGKTALDWRAPTGKFPRDVVKLFANLVLMAIEATPREGAIIASFAPGPPIAMTVEASGAWLTFDDAAITALRGNWVDDELDARSVAPVHTHILAKALNARLDVRREGKLLTLSTQI